MRKITENQQNIQDNISQFNINEEQRGIHQKIQDEKIVQLIDNQQKQNDILKTVQEWIAQNPNIYEILLSRIEAIDVQSKINETSDFDNTRNTKSYSDNWYQQEINKKREKYFNEYKKTFKLSEFREEFADLVLMMRNKCLDICNKIQEKTTYEEDAIYESCKYVSVSINELCRIDADLIIDSYEYDESFGFLNVNISELKMLQKYNIDKIYCDGESCKFSTITSDQTKFVDSNSDFVIRFKACSKFPVNNNTTKHIITIMSGCMEFCYDVSTKHYTKNAVSFIDYHRDKIPDFKL